MQLSFQENHIEPIYLGKSKLNCLWRDPKKYLTYIGEKKKGWRERKRRAYEEKEKKHGREKKRKKVLTRRREKSKVEDMGECEGHLGQQLYTQEI